MKRIVMYTLVLAFALGTASSTYASCSNWKIDNVYSPSGCVDLYQLDSHEDGVCVYTLHSRHC